MCRESLVLEVAVGKFLDTSLIRADVQPRVARLLIKGRLLQLVLPAEVGGCLTYLDCLCRHTWCGALGHVKAGSTVLPRGVHLKISSVMQRTWQLAIHT